MSTMKKAVIYSRVSTTEQTKGWGIETQVNGCREYALRNDLEVIEIIKDDISGATRLEEREGGLRLLEFVNKGSVETVIVWRLDRLSRPPQNEYSRLLTTYEQFANRGVELHSVETGKIDGPMGAMIVFFKSIGASEERAAIRDRTMKAKLAKAKSGKWVGNGRPCYGYRKVGKGAKAKLEIDEFEASIVIRIFSMFLGINGEKKRPLRTIARILTQEGIPSPGRSKGKGGAWYATTIYYRILSNDIYLGNVTYKGFTVNHPELALIDEDIWLKVQEQLAKNKKKSKRNRKHDYLLTGHIKCSCGGSMNGTYSVNPKKTKIFYYRCSRKRIYNHIAECKEKSLRLDIVDDMVWQWIEGLLSDETALEEGLLEMTKQAENELEPTKNRISTIDTILAQKERNLSRLLSVFGEEEDPIIGDALQNEIRETAHIIKSLSNERKGLEDKLKQIGITPEKQDWIREIARKVRSKLDSGGTSEDKRNLLDILNFEATTGEKENGERFLEVKCWLGEDALLYIADDEKYICQQIENAGGTCWFMINDSTNDIADRYRFLHAKFILIDGQQVVISSENLSPNSMPSDNKTDGTWGRRGIVLVTDAPGVVGHVQSLFDVDFDPTNHVDITGTTFIGGPPSGFMPNLETGGITYTVRFPNAAVFNGASPLARKQPA